MYYSQWNMCKSQPCQKQCRINQVLRCKMDGELDQWVAQSTFSKKKLEDISNQADLILNQAYMLGLSDDFIEELPVFKELLEHLYEKKNMHGRKI